jgi:catechol 2,3-dioxygenase-like lactoylglutathione lyase family enzyme
MLIAVALAAAASPATNDRGVAGWSEAVVSVRDLERTASLFRDLGGWRDVARGKVDRAELAYWKLPASATATFLKICAVGVDAGCIRFVRFAGVAQRPIRLAARPWDTGGIFSLMLRSTDVRTTFARAIERGWTAETEPYRFDFNGSALWNVVLSNAEGLNIALYERMTPPFTDYPLTAMSRAFNSMRMVRDQRASVAYYAKLGFSQAFDSDYIDTKPGPNNFSIPENYADKITRRASAMHPVKAGTGRVELMQFVGLTGKDVSAFAAPPNLGVVSLRFPVRDLAAYRASLDTGGVPIAYQASDVKIVGLGTADLIAVRDPDGNITEFYQLRAGR